MIININCLTKSNELSGSSLIIDMEERVSSKQVAVFLRDKIESLLENTPIEEILGSHVEFRNLDDMERSCFAGCSAQARIAEFAKGVVIIDIIDAGHEKQYGRVDVIFTDFGQATMREETYYKDTGYMTIKEMEEWLSSVRIDKDFIVRNEFIKI